MTPQDLIKFLRQSVLVQDTADVTSNNPEYLSISDEDLALVLQMALSKIDPSATLNTMDDSDAYPTVLMAKKELFHRLALPKAQNIKITVSGATLNKDQIFNHYMILVSDVNKEYTEYLSVGLTMKSGEVFLNSRYYTLRNYNHSAPPEAVLSLDNVYADKAEVSWELTKLSNLSKFYAFELYVGTTSNIDKYSKKYNGYYAFSSPDLIVDSAQKVASLYDLHLTCYRIPNLQPNTTYYVTLVVEECNGLKGYSEIEITTLPATP